MTKNKTLNEKQTALINALNTTTDGLTLAEASAIAGVEIRPGSVNPLVGKYIEKCGTKEIVVTTKRTVNVYRLKDGTTVEVADTATDAQ